ncbi:hypothetical protein HDU99_006826 [Rhizoclosmatium hyalinum]|nr:hypothetical protein HDU99_006826 [Rhizoclosmatium hyalinum]
MQIWAFLSLLFISMVMAAPAVQPNCPKPTVAKCQKGAILHNTKCWANCSVKGAKVDLAHARCTIKATGTTCPSGYAKTGANCYQPLKYAGTGIPTCPTGRVLAGNYCKKSGC